MTTKTVRVERSYLIRVVQTYDLTIDESLIPEDPYDVCREMHFDDLVCSEGILVNDHEEQIENDDFTIRFLDTGQPAAWGQFDPGMIEFGTTVGDLHGSPASDVTVEVYKLGGGTFGREYEGDWGYRVSRLLDQQVLAQGEDYHTGTPRGHMQVAREVAKLVKEQRARAA